MKLLEKKEKVAILYCVLFVISAILIILSKNALIILLTSFVISMYFLVVVLSKNEKVNRAFSIMLAIYMLYPIFNRCYGIIQSIVDANNMFSWIHLFSYIATILLYLYLVYRLLLGKKSGSSKILYYVISGLCFVVTVVSIVLNIVETDVIFLVSSFGYGVLNLLMDLLLVRYAYLYK